MKTLKFIGMASLAVVLCVDFTACSKDNDDLKRTKTILVKTAGTLSTLIPAEEIEQITNLTLSGYINGDDVRFIQKMYNLTKADFTDLHIIGGGGTYETYPDYEYKYTRDNVFPCVFDSRQRDVLNEIKLPNSITGIEEGAFRYCANLTSIKIPNSVTSIGAWAFNDCTSLTSIEIPNSVTSIGEWAFWDAGLKKIHVKNSTPPKIMNNTFSTYAYVTLYVPVGSKENYTEHQIWRKFNIIEEQ